MTPDAGRISATTPEQERIAPSIETIDSITPDHFTQNYERRNRPLLIKNLQWKPPPWSRESLTAKLANEPLTIEVYPKGMPQYQRTILSCHTEQMNFSSYLDASEKHPGQYYMAINPEKFEGLSGDLLPPPLVPRNRFPRSLLFVGHTSLSSGHYHDGEESFLIQLAGTKTVTLYPPSDLKHLKLHPWYSIRRYHGLSQLEFDTPEANKQLRKTQPLEAVVGPNDILFIPRDWLHVVRSNNFAISWTVFWREQCLHPVLNSRILRSRFRRFTARRQPHNHPSEREAR